MKRRRNGTEVREFKFQDLTDAEIKALTEAFKKSYLEATGAAWSTSLFHHKARSWLFYGVADGTGATGVVAIRPQRSGNNKLVGMAGNPRGILKGAKLLKECKGNQSIWGAVSEELLPVCERMGLIAVHSKPGGIQFIKQAIPMIPAEVFGGMTVPKVRGDGAVLINVEEIGVVPKFFVANPAYFKSMMELGVVAIPTVFKAMLAQMWPLGFASLKNPSRRRRL